LKNGSGLLRAPWVPYVAPFAVFMAFVALHSSFPLPAIVDESARIVVVGLVIAFFSRSVLDFRVHQIVLSVLMGVLIFVVWVLPNALIAGYRQSFLFNNAVVGKAATSLTSGVEKDWLTLTLRTARATLIVPIAEELFWRGWLVRWFIAPDFTKVPLGAFTALSFWATALLFAAEHGPYWDVGFIAGILFNLWMIRTKSLGDLILVHAVANLCLSAYVMIAGKWEYWL
jgi:uncharacterized protein